MADLREIKQKPKVAEKLVRGCYAWLCGYSTQQQLIARVGKIDFRTGLR